MRLYTDTTKERLQELEAQQRQLEENILIEKSKVKVAPSEKDLSKYIKHAIQQVPQKIVDLLIDKVIVYNDKLIIYPKYLGITHDDETPDGQSDRGLLLLSVSMFYEKKIMRLGPKKAGATLFEMREIAVEIMI